MKPEICVGCEWQGKDVVLSLTNPWAVCREMVTCHELLDWYEQGRKDGALQVVEELREWAVRFDGWETDLLRAKLDEIEARHRGE